jgi:cardiolipin synthase
MIKVEATAEMSKRWNKNSICTVPNAMSMIRLCLIPVYLLLYCKKELYGWAVAVLVISGITDMFDGKIARQFDQVSDIGKVLDPVADKLTQAALIISLAGRYSQIWVLFGLFAAKELLVAAAGIIVLVRTDTVNSARWFGKVTTLVLEVSMGILVLFPHISESVANGLFVLCGLLLIGSLVGYLRYDIQLIREHGHQPRSAAAED